MSRQLLEAKKAPRVVGCTVESGGKVLGRYRDAAEAQAVESAKCGHIVPDGGLTFVLETTGENDSDSATD